jgi:hypothetical protein
MKNNIKTTISYLAKTAFVLAFVLIGSKTHATSMVTLSVSNIGTTSATITARAQNAVNDTTIRGSFEYATNPSFVSSDYTNETTMNIAGAIFSYTQTITGLTPSTTYYVRALGIGNQDGIATPGSTLKFTTSAAPVVTTPTTSMLAANTTGTTTATLEMYYNDGGAGSVDVWFEYGTSLSFGNQIGSTTKSGFGNYSVNLSGLQTGTTYYVRSAVKTGTTTVYSSGNLMFKTDVTTGGGGPTPTYVYGCMRTTDRNYNPSATYHDESFCYGTNNNNNNGWNNWMPWNWGTWGNGNNTGNTGNTGNGGSYTDPNDLGGNTTKNSGSKTTTSKSNTVSVKSSNKTVAKGDSVDANKFVASAFFGFGSGFLPTTLVGWLLLIFLILLLIVLTRHYFHQKPVVAVVKK